MKTVQTIPTATREGKTFRVQGRKGIWKYVNGRSKPKVTKTNQANHVIAKVVTKKGRQLVRGFIRVRKWIIANDGMIIERLRSGRIRVDAATARVYRLIESRGMWQELSQYEDRRGYLFVRLYRGLERKKVAVHRLVIMADIDGEIPEGFDVDHRNKNIQDNRLENIRLLRSETNRCTNLASDF